jgi:hypothetical protein
MDIRPEHLPVVRAADQDGYDGGYVAVHLHWEAYGRTPEEARKNLAKKLNKIPVKKSHRK